MALRDPVCETIDGHKYKVVPLPAGRGMALLPVIGRVIGPALAEAQNRDYGAAAREFFKEATPEALAHVCKEFAETTSCELDPGNGKLAPLRENFDLHFSGNYGAMLDWLTFCMKVNYRPLVVKIVAMLAQAGTQTG